MKLLITGSSGFIGRHLAEHFEGQHAVFAPNRAELDLCEADDVADYLRLHRFDVVLHTATARADRESGPPPRLIEENCRMYAGLARCADLYGRLIFLSSGAVYDRRHWQPRMPESYFDAHVPADPYGFSKYLCAKHLAALANAVELRLFGVFGTGENWRVRFLSNACARAAWDLPLVIRQNANFDYLDVRDMGPIIDLLLSRPLKYSAYNVCSGRVYPLAELADMVLAASGKQLPVYVGQPGLGRECSGAMDRLREEVDLPPPRPMAESVTHLYQWYDEHRFMIDPSALSFDAVAR